MPVIQLPKSMGTPGLPGTPMAQARTSPVLARAQFIDPDAGAMVYREAARSAQATSAFGATMAKRAIQRQDELDKTFANDLYRKAITESTAQLEEKVFSLQGKDIANMGEESRKVMDGIYQDLYGEIDTDSQRRYFDDLYNDLNMRTQKSVITAQARKEEQWKKQSYDDATTLAVESIQQNPSSDNLDHWRKYLDGLAGGVFQNKDISKVAIGNVMEKGLQNNIASLVGEGRADVAADLVNTLEENKDKYGLSAGWIAANKRAVTKELDALKDKEQTRQLFNKYRLQGSLTAAYSEMLGNDIDPDKARGIINKIAFERNMAEEAQRKGQAARLQNVKSVIDNFLMAGNVEGAQAAVDNADPKQIKYLNDQLVKLVDGKPITAGSEMAYIQVEDNLESFPDRESIAVALEDHCTSFQVTKLQEKWDKLNDEKEKAYEKAVHDTLNSRDGLFAQLGIRSVPGGDQEKAGPILAARQATEDAFRSDLEKAGAQTLEDVIRVADVWRVEGRRKETFMGFDFLNPDKVQSYADWRLSEAGFEGVDFAQVPPSVQDTLETLTAEDPNTAKYTEMLQKHGLPPTEKNIEWLRNQIEAQQTQGK